MASSSTRSTRRHGAEPHNNPQNRHVQQQQQQQHHHHHQQQQLVATHTRSHHALKTAAYNGLHQQQQPSSRTNKKRPSQDELEALKPKRARITVEIRARPPLQQARFPAPSTTVRPPSGPPPKGAAGAAAAVANAEPPNPPSNPAPAATTAAPPAPTKHREKVKNGIKHELHRLQPSNVDTKAQGRKLRSQEATRYKSELSAYFPDYDEVIGNDPKEQHILSLDTPIIVVDTPHPVEQKRRLPPQGSAAEGSPHGQPPDPFPVRGYGDALFKDVCDSQRIDFGFLETRYKGKTLDDPLPDVYFEPAHKKAERLERSIRNSEKGRAQHEKDQIIRLLEGLQGHDWLRTMGVSGITESRKRAFEPARQHFIKGCQAILEKFRLWALEEKRRKLEKDRAIAEKAKADEGDAEDEGGEDEEDELASEDEGEDEDEDEEMADSVDGEVGIEDDSPGHDDGDGQISDDDPPDYSDADASIAKQLREDVMARSTRMASKSSKRPRPPELAGPPPEPVPQREFTSFFEKRYQRDAALNKRRRTGRTVLAWGHPVPEAPEGDFDLPEEYRDEETLKVHARRKRRDRRGSRH